MMCRYKVGWDESTAGDRQPRVSLWEIEPLTTFPMYPSLFPLRLKRPWHPGPSSMHDNGDPTANGLMWLRGGTGEQPTLNFQSVSMFPLMQQKLDPSLLGNDHNQQYQAFMAAGMQSGDTLRQHFMQLPQPFQYVQQIDSRSPLLLLKQQQQQAIHQSIPHNVLQAQSQVLTENMPRHLLQQLHNQLEEQTHAQQQQHIYHDVLKIQSDKLLQRQQPSVSSSSFAKTDLMESSTEITASITPMHNMLGSLPEGSGNLLNFSRTGQSMFSEQLPQQSWGPKYSPSRVNAFANSVSLRSYDGTAVAVEPENCNSYAQNSTIFGVNVDSSGLLLPTTVSRFATSVDPDVSSMALGDTAFNNPMYGCMQDSAGLMPSAGQIEQHTNFVKVYKLGSVGRSVDISRFSSYNELREELAQMFGIGIEGKLEDPLRSGWQLVFVDRENDVLLLGDDPWEAFVNNVWYIKILSQEDMQTMGEQGVESISPSSGQRMNSSNGVRGHVPSLEY